MRVEINDPYVGIYDDGGGWSVQLADGRIDPRMVCYAYSCGYEGYMRRVCDTIGAQFNTPEFRVPEFDLGPLGDLEEAASALRRVMGNGEADARMRLRDALGFGGA